MAGPNNPFHKSIFKFQFCPVMIKIIHNSKLSVLLASKWENFWNSISEFCWWEKLTRARWPSSWEGADRRGRPQRCGRRWLHLLASCCLLVFSRTVIPSITWFRITLSPYGRHSRRLNVSLHIFRRAVGGAFVRYWINSIELHGKSLLSWFRFVSQVDDV